MWDWIETLAKHWETIAGLSGGVALVWHFAVRKTGAVRQFFVRLNTSMAAVDQISKNLGPNGGSSLADSIRSTEINTRLLTARFAALIDSDPRPRFEANADGFLIHANRSVLELFGCQEVDLRDSGFFSKIDFKDRATFAGEWHRAIQEKRTFDMTVRCYLDKGLAHVRFTAQPVRDASLVLGWWGAIDLAPAVSA